MNCLPHSNDGDKLRKTSGILYSPAITNAVFIYRHILKQ